MRLPDQATPLMGEVLQRQLEARAAGSEGEA